MRVKTHIFFNRLLALTLTLVLVLASFASAYAVDGDEEQGGEAETGVETSEDPMEPEEPATSEDPVEPEEPDTPEEPAEPEVIDLSAEGVATVTGITNKTFTGKAIVQSSLTVKVGDVTLKNGVDYTVKYASNVKVGTARVTIKAVEGSGYTGSITQTFKINSRTSMRFKVSGSDMTFKSKVQYDDPLATNCIPTALELTGAKDSIKLSWKKPVNTKDIDGYIILRRVGSSLRYYQIATVSKGSVGYIDKTAKKKNEYYGYRIVGYKKVGGQYRITSKSTPWVGGVTSNSYRQNVYTPEFKDKSKSATLSKGGTKTIKIKFPVRAKNKTIRWSTSNAKVATVSDTGKVKAVGVGTCYITAKSATGRTARYQIRVTNIKYGIDVSTWQDNIDWKKVKADGIDFAFIRVGFRGSSSGKLVLDNKYVRNITNAKAAGLKVGVYFFSQAKTYQEGVEEADFVYKQIRQYKLDLPVVIDTEYLDGRTNNLTVKQRTQAVKGFCEQIKKRGYTPMIYANLNWLNNKLDMSQLPYQVWVAQWSSSCTYTGSYKCWQYTSNGRVDGIDGRVDLDYWYE
ncbi:MAG: Ig-like domain-containing protein [Mogibacterium sp.]|nr:Ig-like domain-containing protein [Mogibacterium sp.]